MNCSGIYPENNSYYEDPNLPKDNDEVLSELDVSEGKVDYRDKIIQLPYMKLLLLGACVFVIMGMWWKYNACNPPDLHDNVYHSTAKK